MPGKTNSDKISELEKLVEKLAERLDTARGGIEQIFSENADTERSVADLRRESEKAIALLNQRVEKDIALLKGEHDKELALLRCEVADLTKWKDDQKKQKEELERRVWAFGPNVIAALISVLLSAAIAAYLSSRR